MTSTQILIQGSYEPLPTSPDDAIHFFRLALAQVLPSEEGLHGQDPEAMGMGKLRRYAQMASEEGADGETDRFLIFFF